jgi:flagellar motor switch protein FliN
MSVQVSNSVDPQSALLQNAWVECLRGVLSQVAGFPVTVEPDSEDEAPAAEDAAAKSEVWAQFATSKAVHGEMATRTTEAGAVQLAQVLMSEPPDSTVAFDPGRREAYDEFLSQVVGQIATALKGDAGGDVEIKPSAKDAPTWQEASRVGVRIGGEKLATMRLLLVVSAELAASFREIKEKSASAASIPDGPSAPATDLPGARSSNLELLLDVTLDATICFGKKQMLLRDILELHPGAAIVLDRQVDEPVDLLVGGRMVARGEVVIVDGNYGLRITEIVSPQQRIASLAE